MRNRISKFNHTLGSGLALVLLAVVGPSAAEAAIIANLNPTVDLYIDPVESRTSVGQIGDSYNTNTANDIRINSGILLLGNPSSLRDFRAFLKFDLSSLNIGSVVSATLRLNMEDLGGDDAFGDGELRRINLSDWTGASVTYAHGSASNSTSISTFAVATNPSPGFYSIDVTSTVQGWASGSFNNFGFTLKQAAEGFGQTGRQFTSADGTASLVPLLTIQFVPVPEPSTLALLGLGAIGLATGTRRRRRAA